LQINGEIQLIIKNLIMKKFNLCIIVILLMVGLFSCKKDTIVQQQTQEGEVMMRSKKVIALIHNFEQKMNEALKSGETISLDSAIWNMEASLNYTYADPEEAIGEYSFIKSNYTLEVDANGVVSMSEVQAVYSLMEQDLGNDLKSGNDEVIIFSDVALDSISGGTAYLSGTNGYSSGIARSYTPIDDNWYWGTLGQEYGNPLLGNCAGTDTTSDASDELQWRLNNPMPVPTQQIFYIDLVTEEAIGDDFLDSNYEPRLYMGWDYPEDNCLTITMLTDYLNESDDIIYTYQSSGGLRPANKDFVRVYIADWLLLGSPYGGRHIHHYDVTYGTPTNVPPPN
jgi:hypothetical protein